MATFSLGQGENKNEVPFNKLREMYSFYYLPFNLQFKVGTQPDDIFPVTYDEMGLPTKIVSPDDMKKIENAWKQVREEWKKKSLFLKTSVEIGKKVRISPHLVSHKIPSTNSAVDTLDFSTRLIFQKSLQNQSPEIQSNVTQLFFLKSFLEERDK